MIFNPNREMVQPNGELAKEINEQGKEVSIAIGRLVNTTLFSSQKEDVSFDEVDARWDIAKKIEASMISGEKLELSETEYIKVKGVIEKQHSKNPLVLINFKHSCQKEPEK